MAKVKQKDSLGNRMKENYENRAKTKLLRRMPVIIRLDGKAFHSFTKGFAKPFDARLMEAMQETTLELCKSIQGCVFGYTQSDEITLVLVDYQTLSTDAWFDYEVQKLCSISASMATLIFNRLFARKVNEFIKEHGDKARDVETYGSVAEDISKLINTYKKAVVKGGLFDSRCFNLPISEVANCILWRERDAERNSISSLAQAYFSHKELQNKKSNEMQDMLMEKHNINWNDLETPQKRGTAVVRDENGNWIIDKEMPILTGLNRAYVESRIIFEDA